MDFSQIIQSEMKENNQSLSDDCLQNISKSVLVKYFDRQIEFWWDRLPTHLKIDLDVLSCRICRRHHNQPGDRDHIDGPAPMIKNCPTCQKIMRDCLRFSSQKNLF